MFSITHLSCIVSSCLQHDGTAVDRVQVTGNVGTSSVHKCVCVRMCVYLMQCLTELLGSLCSMCEYIVAAAQQLDHRDHAPASLTWKPCLDSTDNRLRELWTCPEVALSHQFDLT